ncbi:unnamed protein product [Gongylonema pulchrum]|uniref:Uncharacterized protein n=1 Tax=Gongylonema pulchrum TaxID=637853 RepID=A0A183DZA3_9BILA|nr:unnamed protein product [Gongylonema pulchrum]
MELKSSNMRKICINSEPMPTTNVNNIAFKKQMDTERVTALLFAGGGERAGAAQCPTLPRAILGAARSRCPLWWWCIPVSALLFLTFSKTAAPLMRPAFALSWNVEWLGSFPVAGTDEDSVARRLDRFVPSQEPVAVQLFVSVSGVKVCASNDECASITSIT